MNRRIFFYVDLCLIIPKKNIKKSILKCQYGVSVSLSKKRSLRYVFPDFFHVRLIPGLEIHRIRRKSVENSSSSNRWKKHWMSYHISNNTITITRTFLLSQTLVWCTLARVEVVSSLQRTFSGLKRLRSHFRQHNACSGGNLIKIDTEDCSVSSAGKRRCKPQCNGSSTKNAQTSKWPKNWVYLGVKSCEFIRCLFSVA